MQRVTLFLAALALVVSLGANLTSYRLTQDQVEAAITFSDRICRASAANRIHAVENREALRKLVVAALAQLPEGSVLRVEFERVLREDLPPIGPFTCPE